MNKPTTFDLNDMNIEISTPPEEVFEPIIRDVTPPHKLTTLFWSAAGGLFSLAMFASLYAFVENMFQKAPWLGWIAATGWYRTAN